MTQNLIKHKTLAQILKENYKGRMNKNYDAIALFSGGLDSILAAKVLEEQGLKVKCLHFVTPFFGNIDNVASWQEKYELDIDSVDVSADFVKMMVDGPKNGFGKLLNPCVDCKILMLGKARECMEQYGVSCVASGEVVGQRPMSQRRDTLNIIRRDSGLGDELLRPLSARLLEPTKAELSGLINRDKLLSISGRGRKDQLSLAAHFGIKDIPTPAGGCRLAEQENAARYAKVLIHQQNPLVNDFCLAQSGRQYWSAEGMGEHWLAIGRDANSNAQLEKLISPQDIVFKLCNFAGPLALGRQINTWPMDIIKDAASFVASFAPKAVKSESAVFVRVKQGGNTFEVEVSPNRATKTFWAEPKWPVLKKILRGKND